MTQGVWYENEQFWQGLFPYMFDEGRLAAGEEQVQQVLELTGLQGRDVLDLCCGPGRHSVALAERGWSVTGVDRTPFLLVKARERAEDRVFTDRIRRAGHASLQAHDKLRPGASLSSKQL